MTDEHRKKLESRLTPLHVYQLTPKTNCGECGFLTCLAFSTQLIVGQADIEACPYLDKEALEPLRTQIAEQHRCGIGVKRESFEKTLQFLRQEVQKWDFEKIAWSLGAEFANRDGIPSLKLFYLGRTVTVTPEDISDESSKGINPWEKIFLYNYVIGGAVEPAGQWIGMEALPNSISKIRSLKAHCEDRLAQAFAGKINRLPLAIHNVGHALPTADEGVDFAAEFQLLPKLAIRIYWWDEDPAEGFDAQTKFLFDARVLQVLDLESLIFACEQVTDRLLEAAH